MKVSEAITKVALNMSLVSGSGMSPYSEDQIQQYLSNAHDMLTSKYTWPELVSTIQFSVDQVTGYPSVAFTAAQGITDYKQIKHVYINSYERELPLISAMVNPINSSNAIGYSALSIVDDPDKKYLIKINPPTAGITGAIVANLKADFSNPNTVVPIDDLLHIWIATWMWAEDDATNPGQAEKYLNLWKDRVLDLRSNVNAGPYSVGMYNGPSTQWAEYP